MRKRRIRLAVNNTRKPERSPKRVSKIRVFLYTLVALIVLGFVFRYPITEQLLSWKVSNIITNLTADEKSEFAQGVIDGVISNADGTLPRRINAETVLYEMKRTDNTAQLYYRIEVSKGELLNALEKNEFYQGLKYSCEDYRSVIVPELGLIMTLYFSSENGDEEIAYTLSNETCNWD
ncbi:hypothetical protein N8128_06825 [Paracoccaceae bacterium]|nr:hypothetical protein [Paracoccaceae bacterium]